MDPVGLAAAAEGIETLAQGAIGAAIVVAKPTMPLKGKYTPIPLSINLPRCSHSLCVVHGRAYVFGGSTELGGEPVPSDMHVFILPSGSVSSSDYKCVSAASTVDAPAPRAGHSATSIGSNIYVYGGRGEGGAGKPALADEWGSVYCFDTLTSTWSRLAPAENTPVPEPRYYHAAAGCLHPVSSAAEPSSTTPQGTLLIHGGQTSSSRSLADVWAFDVQARTWTCFPDAPGPPRSGASLAFAGNRLYRFGGFDDDNSIGGSIDYLEIAKGTFDDKSGKGELCIMPKSGIWESVEAKKGTATPGERIYAGMHPITTGQGRNYLVLLMGENLSIGSSGKFWDDAWTFQLRPEGLTGASLKDATRALVGVKSAEDTWAKLEIPEASKTQGVSEAPGGRGYFGSALNEENGGAEIVLWGGFGENIGGSGQSKVFGDAWLLTVDPS